MPKALSLDELGRRFRDASLSPQQVAHECLAAIRRDNDALGCFFHIADAICLAEARKAADDFSSGIDHGPLQGIPYAVADVIDVAGLPTTCGSRSMQDHVADRTSNLVATMRSAGAVLVGKTSIFEFAIGGPGSDSLFPPARNPYDLERIAGATGAGAAVAAGLIGFAIVPDTGGAARGSAALCGVVGMKPSFGLLSCDGIFPVSASLDHCGIITSCVNDASTVLNVMAGSSVTLQSQNRPVPDVLRDLRIGAINNVPGTQPPMQRALKRVTKALQANSARIMPIAVDYFDQLLVAGQVIYAIECLAIHRNALRDHPELYARNTRNRLVIGAFLTDDDYAKAKRVTAQLSRRFDTEIMSHCDIVLCPTAGGPAPLIEASSYGIAGRSGIQTLPFNITGHPAVTIPCGRDEELPLGLQVVGRHNGDAELLRAAEAIVRSLATSST